MHLTPSHSRAGAWRLFIARLRDNTSGVALMEFAFSLPVILGMGMYSVETANLALTNLRISQIALNLADNASRVGMTSSLPTTQLREIDLNDVLQAARYQGQSIKLTTQGRIILSSLENVQQTYDSAPVQRIHWQRCIGMKSGVNYDSSYGVATPLTTAGTDTTSGNAGVTKATGIGDPLVNAPAGYGLMFVEINYEYKPIVSGWLLSSNQRIHYVASMIVRDNRDFAKVYNPTPAVSSSQMATCDKYAS